MAKRRAGKCAFNTAGVVARLCGYREFTQSCVGNMEVEIRGRIGGTREDFWYRYWCHYVSDGSTGHNALCENDGKR
jgi:hypothetical protein